MRRIGELVDAATAFFGAAVAGITLYLPTAFNPVTQATPFRIAGLLSSVPRGAALAAIAAVTVAVLISTTPRQVTGWATALAATIAELANHLARTDPNSAGMLTSRNYVDSVCGAVLLGALGAVALRKPILAAAFATGGVGFFVFSDLAVLLRIDVSAYAVLETPPRWSIALVIALLAFSTLRNRAEVREHKKQRIAIELPIAPILAAAVLALVILIGTEWLGRQFSKLPDQNHTVEIGVVVAATLVAATVAAMLMPGRDGVGVFLAVGLSTSVNAIGYAVRPGWSVFVLLALTLFGIAFGARLPSAALAILFILGLTVFAMITSTSDSRLGFAVSSSLIAITAGYCCATARPRYPPSGVLAITALYLPTVVTELPARMKDWQNESPGHNATPGLVAFIIVVGCAVGTAILLRLRHPRKPHPKGQPQSESLADI